MINIYLVVKYRYITTLKLCSSILPHSCCPKQLTEKDKLWSSAIVRVFLKKNLSASRPSEHPTQGEKCRSKADSYGNEKLIRKWTKSVIFIRDQKFGQRQTYGNGFVSAWFRQVWVRSDFPSNYSKLVYALVYAGEIQQ